MVIFNATVPKAFILLTLIMAFQSRFSINPNSFNAVLFDPDPKDAKYSQLPVSGRNIEVSWGEGQSSSLEIVLDALSDITYNAGKVSKQRIISPADSFFFGAANYFNGGTLTGTELKRLGLSLKLGFDLIDQNSQRSVLGLAGAFEQKPTVLPVALVL